MGVVCVYFNVRLKSRRSRSVMDMERDENLMRLGVLVKGDNLLRSVQADTALKVFAYAPFEEVCLALQRKRPNRGGLPRRADAAPRRGKLRGLPRRPARRA